VLEPVLVRRRLRQKQRIRQHFAPEIILSGWFQPHSSPTLFSAEKWRVSQLTQRSQAAWLSKQPHDVERQQAALQREVINGIEIGFNLFNLNNVHHITFLSVHCCCAAG
jgi:hypothetical protein